MTTEFTLDFDDIFNRFIEANQKSWGHDRNLTLGASEVFTCIRKGFFQKRGKEFGFEPDEDYDEDWGALTRGNLIENYHVAPAMQNFAPEGVEVLYTGDDQVTLVSGRSSATPDGLITGLPVGCTLRIKGGKQDLTIDNIISDCICLEIKSIDPRATLLEERAKHHGQTQVQLGLFHERTEYRPYYSIVLYIDASFLSKVTPFVVPYDPEIYKAAKERAAMIWEHDKPTDFIAEGRFNNDCAHCKWTIACGTSTVSSIPKFDDDDQSTPETIAAADKLVADYFSKKEGAEQAERDAEIAKEALKAFLGSKNQRKMRGPTWSMTWFGQAGKKTLDTKAMEADGIDLENYKKEGAPFDVLRVTKRLEESADTPKKPKTPRKSK
jgi:hypothetical protein